MKPFTFLLVFGLAFSCTSVPERVPDLNTSRQTGISGPNAPRAEGNLIVFSLEAPRATLVSIAGQFNGWDPQISPLENNGEGLWSIGLELRPGRHRYKFLVDGHWIPDPDNPNFEPDGFDHYNSILVVE